MRVIKGSRIVLSVKYDVDGFSPNAEIVARYLEEKHGLQVYNPNRYNKEDCGKECSLLGFDCKRYPYQGGRPTDRDCWKSSYRWHLAQPSVVMIAIVEDGALGPGQETERKMAENMHVPRI